MFPCYSLSLWCTEFTRERMKSRRMACVQCSRPFFFMFFLHLDGLQRGPATTSSVRAAQVSLARYGWGQVLDCQEGRWGNHWGGCEGSCGFLKKSQQVSSQGASTEPNDQKNKQGWIVILELDPTTMVSIRFQKKTKPPGERIQQNPAFFFQEGSGTGNSLEALKMQ